MQLGARIVEAWLPPLPAGADFWVLFFALFVSASFGGVTCKLEELAFWLVPKLAGPLAILAFGPIPANAFGVVHARPFFGPLLL